MGARKQSGLLLLLCVFIAGGIAVWMSSPFVRQAGVPTWVRFVEIWSSDYFTAALLLTPPALVLVLISRLRRQEKRELQMLERLLAELKERRQGNPHGSPSVDRV